MKALQEIPHEPNLLLQMLMFTNVYVSILWYLVYAVYLLYYIFDLDNLLGVCVLTAYCTAVPSECYRLYIGYSGNLNDRPADLITFLVLSSVLQIPLMVFLLLSASHFLVLLSIATMAVLLLIFMEFIVGVWVVLHNNKNRNYEIILTCNYFESLSKLKKSSLQK